MALSTLNKVWDDSGELIKHLQSGPADLATLNKTITRIRNGPRPAGLYPANPDVPFFLAVRREHLLKLGGYDEDFIGPASEDCDLLDRLKAIGCHYVYAPPGAEAVHLYHGRRSVKELEADPGFAYNINLRRERKDILVRNEGGNWGELIDVSVPQRRAPIHLVLWVTSRCSLDCPLCNQRLARESLPDYEMSPEELDHFIWSCQDRGIHFSTIELTGGEPTLWPLLDEGIGRLKKSGITDAVTFITNGLQAETTAKVANKHGLFYIVSKHQATPNQVAMHKKTGVGVVWNESTHKPVPAALVPGSLPALCMQRQDMHGRVVRQLFYLDGTVWCCCMAHTNHRIVGEDPDDRMRCPFDEEFDDYFAETCTDRPICSVCLCNKKIWDSLE